MSTTFADQINRVRQLVMGYARNQEQLSFLAQTLGSTDANVYIDPATIYNMSSGIIEVDSELIMLSQVDRNTGQCTVLGGIAGRGWNGTTPVTHANGTIVTSDPMFPRITIKQAITDTIQSLYPDLYVMKSTTVTKSAPVYEYGLPADVSEVWRVNYDTVGPSKLNRPSTNWRFNPQANTDRFPTGKSIQVFDNITPGRKIWISYQAEPGTPVNESDDLGTTTGFGADYDRFTDLVSFGSGARLLAAYEGSRQQLAAIESSNRSESLPPGSAARVSQYFFTVFQQMLAEERTRFQEKFDTMTRYSGGN